METQEELNEQIKVRLEKISQLRNAGYHPYAERFERNYRLHEAAALPDGTKGVRVAGRVVSLRYFGKLAFGHLYDIDGKMQFAVQKNKLVMRSLMI